MWERETKKLTKTTVLPEKEKRNYKDIISRIENDMGRAYHNTVTMAQSVARKDGTTVGKLTENRSASSTNAITAATSTTASEKSKRKRTVCAPVDLVRDMTESAHFLLSRSDETSKLEFIGLMRGRADGARLFEFGILRSPAGRGVVVVNLLLHDSL